MRCERCLNEDDRYFIKHKERLICRKCITLQSGVKENELLSFNETKDSEYSLDFSLSLEQKELSYRLVDLVLNHEDVLVYAACGCGKTEIILELLKVIISQGLKIGIAIPRRQVVLELQNRLSTYFKNLKVIAVCEGYTQELWGDLIICTTHQLHNYEDYFDVLVVDEPDAFPFANNDLLKNVMRKSYKQSVVYLTATPDETMLSLKTLSLFRRYHGYDLLVPKVYVGFSLSLIYRMYQFIKSHPKVMVFVPTIKLAKKLSRITKYPCIHSKTDQRESILNAFSNDDFKVLITTTIMERGVTFKGVDVCVLYADHHVFTKASLIQIAGRVGRVASHPSGDGIFLCENKSKKVDECIETLRMMNA